MMQPVVHRILAPVELTDTDAPEFGYAIGLAAQLKAELLLLAVIDTPTSVALIRGHRARSTTVRGFEQNLVQEVRALLQQVVDRAAAAGVKALGHVTLSEEVEEQILKEALVKKVDLIVVRSRGATGIMKALLGSTAGEILKAAPCPVLVARFG